MNQLTGRIEALTAKSGFRPSLEIQLFISNPNESGIDLTWVSARAAISFFDMSSQGPSSEQPRNLGPAFPDYTLPSMAMGGKNTLVLSLQVDASLIAQVENERKELDVALHLSVNFSAVPRTRDGSLGSPFSGTIADEKYSGQTVVFIVPRSLWSQIIQRFSITNLYDLKDLSKIISETRAAKSEAEEAAKAAQEAAKALSMKVYRSVPISVFRLRFFVQSFWA